jgi:hypothetical protein
MCARHRLAKLLLRHDLRFPVPGGNWTGRHHDWLGRLSFEDAAARATFVDYLAAVQALEQRRRVLDEAIGGLAKEGPRAETIARLRCFRGIDTLSAAGSAARSATSAASPVPTRLAGYLGITPRSGPPTSGAARARSPRRDRGTPVACWSRPPTTTPATPSWAPHCAAARKARTPASARSPGAQRRIHLRWSHLRTGRGKPVDKTAVACAREFVCFVWEAAVLD